ncbi:MAG: alpha/beta fold hydrolase [Pseudonocardia sp.]|nr:alpha/beta fold hydrolase [Pseudonocardia sp.]
MRAPGPRPKRRVGHFRTPQGRKAYVEAYTATLDLLPEAPETRDVATGLGTVRACVWANDKHAGRTPVVLLPGRASGAPMWRDNLPDLIAHRTVYAFDALGDAGLSEQTIPLRDMADQAQWVEQAMAGLGIDRAHLVGHSQGGGLAAAVAVRHPDRLASLTLLEPVLTLSWPPAWVWLHLIPASLPLLPQSWREHALNRIGGVADDEVDPNDPVVRMIALAARHYSSAALPNPSPLSEYDLTGLAVPVYVAIASDDSVAGGDAAAHRAALIPDVQVKVWSDTTHSLPMQVTSELDAELEVFWAAHP